MKRTSINHWARYVLILFGVFVFLLPAVAAGSATDGTIDAANFTSPLLDDLTGLWDVSASHNLYWNVPVPYEVHVFDTELTGYLWGDALGWISLNCSNKASCANGDFKVGNDSEGHLFGYAWGEHAGWMSFSCANPETDNCTSNANARVTINASGEFSGYAWTENFGWVIFDCAAGPAACVKTDWRPASSRLGAVAGASVTGISIAGFSGGNGLGADFSLPTNGLLFDPLEDRAQITQLIDPAGGERGKSITVEDATIALSREVSPFPIPSAPRVRRNLFDISSEPEPENRKDSMRRLIPIVLAAAIPLGLIGRAGIIRLFKRRYQQDVS